VTRIVVIGGGVIAWRHYGSRARASRPESDAALLERSETLGSGATARNGGRELSYSYADALGSQAVLFDLPRLLCGLDPAFRIRASVDPCFWIWAVRFLANCTSARFSANTLAVLRLALRSRSRPPSPRLTGPGTPRSELRLTATRASFTCMRMPVNSRRPNKGWR
jgi:D-amino-acid dehydrogenase